MSNDFSLRCRSCGTTVFKIKITHNLIPMAEAAGLYEPIWYPNQRYRQNDPPPARIYHKAEELISILKTGYHRLRSKPDAYKQLNPPNGWGSYQVLCDKVGRILAACQRYPETYPYAYP